MEKITNKNLFKVFKILKVLGFKTLKDIERFKKENVKKNQNFFEALNNYYIEVLNEIKNTTFYN